MLYDAYEFQRSMMAGASRMASFGADMLNNPANPFAYLGGGTVVASALEVFAHANATRGKPAARSRSARRLCCARTSGS
jgi:poly(3-hydroxybutyrate) depolymerase